MSDTILVAIGCYTESMSHVDGKGEGIELLTFDRATGTLSPRETVIGPRNPSYLAISPKGDRLYAVEELDADAGPELYTWSLDREAGTTVLLSRVPLPGAAACHVSTDRDARFVFVSNFVSGDLVVYRMTDGVPEGTPQVISRPAGAHGHCALVAPDGETLLFCDAGHDAIAGYRLEHEGLDPEPLFELKAPEGSFTRHVAIAPDGQSLLVAQELTEALGIASFAEGGLAYAGIVSSLPPGWSGKSTGAAVRFHPNGRTGYMSNRGHDSIVTATIDPEELKLEPRAWTPTGGEAPRDFALDPTGRWLIAANQNSDNLVVFPVDPKTGDIGAAGQVFATGTPVSVLFL
ncbi:MAG TPA: lactonase family protein [Devosia sp.]